MDQDLTDLRGAGCKRLLGAARRNLERTGGALDHSIGLNSPSEAERRLVIGITGSYRPQTGRCILAGTAASPCGQRYPRLAQSSVQPARCRCLSQPGGHGTRCRPAAQAAGSPQPCR